MLASAIVLCLAASSTAAANEHSENNSPTLTDALHSVTSNCRTVEAFISCTDFATNELSDCVPGDLNCHCNKLMIIQQHCQSVCGEADKAAQVFFESNCNGPNPLFRRDDLPHKEPAKSMSAKALVDNLATYQIMEQYPLPFSHTNLASDKMRPVVTNIREEFRQSVEKRGVDSLQKLFQSDIKTTDLGTDVEDTSDENESIEMPQDIEHVDIEYEDNLAQMTHQLYIDDGYVDPMEILLDDNYKPIKNCENPKTQERPKQKNESKGKTASRKARGRNRKAKLNSQSPSSHSSTGQNKEPSKNAPFFVEYEDYENSIDPKQSNYPVVQQASKSQTINILNKAREYLKIHAIHNGTSETENQTSIQPQNPIDQHNSGSKMTPNTMWTSLIITVFSLSCLLVI